MTDSVTVAFTWYPLGDVTVDSGGKLAFPDTRAIPAVYRFEVDDDQAWVYFGEAIDLRQRFGRYRNAGKRQQTNIRMQDFLCHVLLAGGHCRAAVAQITSFQANHVAADLDLRIKAARVLVESIGRQIGTVQHVMG